MTLTVNMNPDRDARILSAGAAPAAQSGAGGQWSAAWSRTGLTAQQKADLTSTTEAWSAIKYTDALATTLGGGDIAAGDLGVSGQSAATTAVKQEIDGKEGLRFVLAEPASAVAINFSSFHARDDGSGYAEGARVRLFDATGVLVGEYFVKAESTSGQQLLQLGSSVAFSAIELSAGALRADGSFSHGAYWNGDGTFGSDIYTDAAKVKHGSDFLVDAISFQLARPEAAADAYALVEDAGLQQFASVLRNDAGTDAAALTAVLATGPAHGTLSLNPDGSFSYQPDANFNGVDAFTYRAFNGKDYSAPARVELSVAAVNDAPVAVAQAATTDEDTVVTGNLLSSYHGGRDMDPDGDALVVVAATLTTAHGATVTIGHDGSYVYDPRAAAALQALNESDSLVDSFAYTVSDGHGGSSTANVQVTVAGKADVADAPQPVITAQVDSSVPLTYYLNYSNEAKQSKWIALDAVALDFSQSGDTITGGGGGAGKASASTLSASFESGTARAELTQMLVTGKHMPDMKVEAYRAGADGALHLVQAYGLENVTVTSLHTLDAAGATGTGAQFTFDHFKQSTYGIDSKGLPTDAVTQWDFSENGNSNGGISEDIHAPVDNFPAVQPELDYYVRLDATSGWLALKDFSMGFDSVGSGLAVSDVSMSLGSSGAMTRMLNALLKGTHLETVEVEAYARGSASPRLVNEYIFRDVVITSLADHGATDNTLGLGYRSFTHGHQDVAGWTGTGYDLRKDQPIAAPVPHAGAATGATIAAAAQVGAEAPMTYILTYGPRGNLSTRIEVDSFQLEFGNSTDAGAAAGGGVGRSFSSALATSLAAGTSTTALTELMTTGKHVQEMRLESWRTGPDGQAQLIQTYQFTDVQVSAFNTTEAAGGTSTGAQFTFGTFTQTTAAVGNTGAPDTATVSWDLAANGGANSIAVDTPIVQKPDMQTALDYYVRFDKTSGWLALDDFSMAFARDAGALSSSDVSMLLGSSDVLGRMLMNLFKGSHIPTVEVEAYARDSATPRLVDDYIFSDVLLTSLESSDISSNTLGLAYSSFTHGHQNYLASGAPSTWTETGYDRETHSLIDGPRPRADAAVGTGIPVAVQTNSDVPLTYYLTYDNGNGAKRIEVDALQLDFANNGNVALGAGGGAGKTLSSTFATSFGASDASAELTGMVVAGKHFQKMLVEAFRTGADGNAQLVQTYGFKDLQVVDVTTTEVADGTSTGVQFTFDAFSQSNPKPGNPTLPLQTVTWDLAANGSAQTLAIDTPWTSQPGTQPDLDYYIRLSDSSGWLALDDFNLGWEHENGTVTSSDVSMVLGSSLVLTRMLTNLFKGTHMPSVEVEAYAHDGAGMRLVDEYIFSQVMLTSVESNGMNDNTVGLAYRSFTHGHQNYDASGTATDWVGAGYDLNGNVTLVAPAPHADLWLG